MASIRTLALLLLPTLVVLLGSTGGTQALQYTIPEEQGVGSFVGDVAADSDLEGRYGADVVRTLEFSFLKEQPALTVEKSGGVIRTAGRLDREEVCPPGAARCKIIVDVAVTPAEYFQIINVVVDVTDINDNSPTFPEPTITRTISELAVTGAKIKLPPAVDLDWGLNGVQEYVFTSSSASNKFRLDVVDNPATNQKILNLVLTGALDREDVDSYQGTLTAYDGGSGSSQSRRSGSTIVTILVEDGNDHSPSFSNDTYTASIPENTPVNTTVLKVTASDADIGEFGRITYAIIGSDTTPGDTTVRKMFGINPTKGVIYLKHTPDYETQTSYTLIVEAADGGPNSQPAQTTVIVNIADLNDNPPDITINALTTSGIAQISESSPVGTFVAHVSVTDADAGVNGEFDCILDADSTVLFALELLPQATQYKIVTAAKFDREAQAQHYVRLTCRDRGTPSSQLSVATVTVRVRDENDNPPAFAQSVYSVTLVENNQVDAFVVAVNATDPDIGENAELTYQLQDSSSPMPLVRIDSHTGIVYANAVFDFETQKEFNFKVVAKDNGEKSLSATATVFVTIVDTNDNAPFFSRTEYEFEVLENEPIGMEIGLVAASDADSAPYNQFEFSLEEVDATSRAAAKLFAVDTRTGHVRTKASLDREYEQEHLLMVVATNVHQDRTLSSSVQVRIVVLDQNDNAPHVDFPNQHNHTLHISNRVPIDYNVGIVKAHDVDEGDNARLAYSFTHNSDNSAFHIDPATGLITTRSSLENYDTKLFEMQVLVSDHGMPPKTATATLYVVVDRSIAYVGTGSGDGRTGSSLLGGTNLTIVVGLAVSSAVVVVILIVAIIFTRMHPRRTGGGAGKPPTFKNPIAGLNLLKSAVKNSPTVSQKSGEQQQQQSKNDQAQNNMNHVKETTTTGAVTVTQQSSLTNHNINTNNMNKKEVSFNMQNETIHPNNSQRGGSNNSTNSDHNKVNANHHHHYQHNPAGVKADNVHSSHRQSWSLPPHSSTVAQVSDTTKCQQWFETMPPTVDPDTDNSSAGEASTTDSGRGPSEEGENSIGSLPPVLGPQGGAAVLPSTSNRPVPPVKPHLTSTSKHTQGSSRPPSTRTSRPPQTHPHPHLEQHPQHRAAPPPHRAAPKHSSRPEVPRRNEHTQPPHPRSHRDCAYGAAAQPAPTKTRSNVASASRDSSSNQKPQLKPCDWDQQQHSGAAYGGFVNHPQDGAWYGVPLQHDGGDGDMYGDNASTTSGSYIVDHKDLDDMIMDSPHYKSVVV